MINHKKYSHFLIGATAIFIIFHMVVWKCCTERILDLNKYPGGDLARTGYSPEVKDTHRTFVNLPKKHINYLDYRGGDIDVVTVGDSFSNEDGGGKQHFYQDYIASINNISVMNITSIETRNSGELVFRNPIDVVISLLNSGFFDKVRPRYVILESVERSCMERMGKRLDFTQRIDVSELTRMDVTKKTQDFNLFKFITEANHKFVFHKFMCAIGARTSTVHATKVQLNSDMFSSQYPRTLLYTPLDIRGMKEMNPTTIALLNSNLNELAARLKNKGIVLYFMPAVDKYDLYFDHIVDNTHSKSIFFETLRPLPKEYRLIDTKKVLRDEVDKGTLDLFFQDDTHWSWKASEKIFRTYRFAQ